MLHVAEHGCKAASQGSHCPVVAILGDEHRKLLPGWKQQEKGSHASERMRASVAVVLRLESLIESRVSISVDKTARICATYMGSDDAVHESPLPETQSCINLYESYCTGAKNVAQEPKRGHTGLMV